jgi:hypothetical protein
MNAALLLSQCGSVFAVRMMNHIVEKVMNTCGQDGIGTREKVRNYISLLASTGRSDEQLLVLGIAYLREILEPDPRYSGC